LSFSLKTCVRKDPALFHFHSFEPDVFCCRIYNYRAAIVAGPMRSAIELVDSTPDTKDSLRSPAPDFLVRRLAASKPLLWGREGEAFLDRLETVTSFSIFGISISDTLAMMGSQRSLWPKRNVSFFLCWRQWVHFHILILLTS
jgi:hypothetical protein